MHKLAVHVCVHTCTCSWALTTQGHLRPSWTSYIEINKLLQDGRIFKNNVLWFKNHLLWTNLIYLEKYTASKKDCMEYPAEQKNSLLWCDIHIYILVANIYINYRFPITQNLKGFDFHLSRSRGVNRIDRVGLLIHNFLFQFNSNT